MGNHEIQITEASVDLDYNEILENIEDTIAARVSDQIADEAWDAVEYQVHEAVSEHEQEYDHDAIGNSNDGVASGVQDLLLEYKNTPKPCGIGIAFEQAVWKAICRLDNPDVEDEWASAAREYLLDRVNKDTPSEAWVAAAKGVMAESNIRAIVALEMRRVMKRILSEMNVSLEAAQKDGSIVLVEASEGQTLEEWQKEMAELRKRARESGAEVAVAPGD
jgi:DNA-binding PucR family transcriptional regulator